MRAAIGNEAFAPRLGPRLWDELGLGTVSARSRGNPELPRSRKNPASIPRTVRTAPNNGGRRTRPDQRFCVRGRPPDSAENSLWTAEKREVIGSTPIPATDKTPAWQGFCCFVVCAPPPKGGLP